MIRLVIGLGELVLSVAVVVLIYVLLSNGLALMWGTLGYTLPVPLYNAESVILFYLLWDRIGGNPIRFVRAAMKYERQRNV